MDGELVHDPAFESDLTFHGSPRPLLKQGIAGVRLTFGWAVSHHKRLTSGDRDLKELLEGLRTKSPNRTEIRLPGVRMVILCQRDEVFHNSQTLPSRILKYSSSCNAILMKTDIHTEENRWYIDTTSLITFPQL